jgi:hypothetical protein
MNNPGCLRSEADRTCLFIGPDAYSRDWCLQRFDDDNCDCQSMGERLSVGPGTSMALKGGHKSYSFRVVRQPSTVVSIPDASIGRLYRYKGMEVS